MTAASNLSAGLTRFNEKVGVDTHSGELGRAGPLGFSGPRTTMRQGLDKVFGVEPREGDPGHKRSSGELAAEEEARKQELRDRINAMYGGDPAAAEQMAGESTELANATRQYYADQLGDDYGKAERNTRFKLARQGLLGGSEDVYQQGDIKQDRDLGATRVDEAVRRAVANLVSQREQERLSANDLVNSGAGDSAVSAAHAGLSNSFENVANQQKADLFSDLFTNSADAVTANNLAQNQAAMLGRYRDRLATFFPARSSSSGRVTPSG